MTREPIHLLLRQLRQRTASGHADKLSDGELVRRFAARHDEEAFAALVRRHGPMVLRLCRRVLHDAHAAEDAFQAVFLVLSRKAALLRRAEAVGSWLFGVATRLAWQARRQAVRRQARESGSASPRPAEDPLAELSVREAHALLGEELARLPEKYRAPLVLCYLQGLTRDEAARRLGWSVKLVKSRLQQGRERLRHRLSRRGLTWPMALVATLLTEEAAPAVLPVGLMHATIRTATASPATVPTPVAALAETILRGMAAAKWKAVVGLLILLSGLTAAGMIAYPQPVVKHEDTPSAERATRRHAAHTDRYGDPLPPGAIARLGTIRLRQGRTIYSLPERDAFLSVLQGFDHMEVRKWRMSTGALLRYSEFHLDRGGSGPAVSSDGQTLAAFGFDRKGPNLDALVRIWDLASGKVTGELKETNYYVRAMVFSPDGKRIAAAGEDQTLRLWDRYSGKELRRFEGAKDFGGALTFSPDGKILVSASRLRRTVRLWDTGTGRELHTFPNDGLGLGPHSVIVFSPDGKTVAVAAGGQKNKTVHLWDVATGKEVRQFQSEWGICSLAFSPDSKILAVGGMLDIGNISKDIEETRPIHLWDVSSGREVHRLPGHVDSVFSLAFSADGKRLLSAGSTAVMKVWDVATGKEVVPLTEHEGWVNSVAFSPDGRHLASGGQDGTIRLWEPATGKLVRVFEGGVRPRLLHLAFAPDGRTLISDRPDGSLRVWDVAAGRQIRQLKVGEEGYPCLFAYSSDGRTLAVRNKDCTVRLLDAATGAEKRQLSGGMKYGTSLCFSPDDRKLASMSFSSRDSDRVLQVWDVATGTEKLKRTFTPYQTPIVFSSDGKTLFGILPDGQTERSLSLRLWDIGSGQEDTFKITQPDLAESLTISPDGRMLAWADFEGTITLWELAANQIRRHFQGHSARIPSLAFSPDGKTLASGSADTTVLIWDVTGRPAARQPGVLPVEQLWADLAHKDASKAFDAVGLLTAAPEQAMPMLKDKLKPVFAAADRKQVAHMIADLDSERFEVRQKAIERLKQLGEHAELGLLEALNDKLSLEARKRVEELLEGVRVLSTSPERLRDPRAVEVLEHIGTHEAKQLLQTLANGAPTARLTREAKTALDRLMRRTPITP
jgi:RNA polymerase sigma factor (sigma-70 family)